MAIYMKHPKIKGNATAEGHKEWIVLDSMQWGVGRAVNTVVGKGEDREASTPSVSEVTVSKVTDKSSGGLFKLALTSPKGEEIQIHICNTTNDKIDTIIEMKLSNSLVSGYSVSSGGDRPSESISINFTKLEYAYTAEGSDNTAGGPDRVAYDVALGKPV